MNRSGIRQNSMKSKIADKRTYLSSLVRELSKKWPDNRTVNIVCHGHSVPSGYFNTPTVRTFDSYPHLLHKGLKKRFPFAVINSIVTAIGGENSMRGAQRFEKEVLCHRPNLITIDYGLNDRGIGLEKARDAWQYMIKETLGRGIKVILLTPTWDISILDRKSRKDWMLLQAHTRQIRLLAKHFGVGLVDSFSIFGAHIEKHPSVKALLSWQNHPNRNGHMLVAKELLKWFLQAS
jgi:acyl-CoA thioesterase I